LARPFCRLLGYISAYLSHFRPPGPGTQRALALAQVAQARGPLFFASASIVTYGEVETPGEQVPTHARQCRIVPARLWTVPITLDVWCLGTSHSQSIWIFGTASLSDTSAERQVVRTNTQENGERSLQTSEMHNRAAEGLPLDISFTFVTGVAVRVNLYGA